MGKTHGKTSHSHNINPKPKNPAKGGKIPRSPLRLGALPSTILLKSQKWSNMTKVLQNLVKGQQRPRCKGLSFLVLRGANMNFFHSYTSIDHILIEILFYHPTNVLKIFELLFHGCIFYEYLWIMLLYVLIVYIITICLCILVVEDKL
jgi:hypothetical protein